jgi:hypothetical protein
MKLTGRIALTVALAVVLAGSALAQRGPRGTGTGFGVRSWVLYENGLDSLAVAADLTDEQRVRLDGLAQEFRTENADAVDRMNKMRAEIDALRTEDQQPTREAMNRIAQEYGYPERDLRPALTKLHEDMAGIITVQQQRKLLRGALAGSERGQRVMAVRGYRAPRYSHRGGRAMWRRRMYRGQRLTLHRIPPPDSQP